MEDKIINKLRYSLKDSHKYKSSYWKNLRYSEDLDDIYGHFGFRDLSFVAAARLVEI